MPLGRRLPSLAAQSTLLILAAALPVDMFLQQLRAQTPKGKYEARTRRRAGSWTAFVLVSAHPLRARKVDRPPLRRLRRAPGPGQAALAAGGLIRVAALPAGDFEFCEPAS